MIGKSYEVYPEPCKDCAETGECDKGEWRQVGYDPNYEGAELIEFECTGCGKMITVTGKQRWTAGRI